MRSDETAGADVCCEHVEWEAGRTAGGAAQPAALHNPTFELEIVELDEEGDGSSEEGIEESSEEGREGAADASRGGFVAFAEPSEEPPLRRPGTAMSAATVATGMTHGSAEDALPLWGATVELEQRDRRHLGGGDPCITLALISEDRTTAICTEVAELELRGVRKPVGF